MIVGTKPTKCNNPVKVILYHIVFIMLVLTALTVAEAGTIVPYHVYLCDVLYYGNNPINSMGYNKKNLWLS